MKRLSRRAMLQAAAASSLLMGRSAWAAEQNETTRMSFGLVTYMWGARWDLPTLLKNCEEAQALGVELRTTHAHGVEPNLNDAARKDVRRRFADSPVTLVGLGSNERFDHADAAALRKAMETAKAFLRLSHDVGGSGVKVKPNSFPPGVPREKTIEQIGRSLNQLGRFAADYGQEVRLEVHGQCAEPATIAAIMEIADHRNVAVCWNSNPQDLQGEGLVHNFNLVRDRFGATCHVRRLDDPAYPYQKLIDLLVKSNYGGWILLEDGRVPPDAAAVLAEQNRLFERMVAQAT